MSFTDRVAQKQAANLPPSKAIRLDDLGEDIVVRALTAGASLRVQALPAAEQGLAIAAFSVESPDKPGEPAWLWNDITHRAQIEKLTIGDFKAIIEAHNELTGEEETDAARLGKSEERENGSTSSPSGSASLPES